MSRVFNPDAYGRPLPSRVGAKGSNLNIDDNKLEHRSFKEEDIVPISHTRDKDGPCATVHSALEHGASHSHVPVVEGNSERSNGRPLTPKGSRVHQLRNSQSSTGRVTIKQQAPVADASQPTATTEGQRRQQESHSLQNPLQPQHVLSISTANSVTWKPKSATTMDKSDQVAARNDRLRMLQDASLRKITRKAAARKEKDNNNTVSMRDLDLARAPVLPDEPTLSLRLWAVDSPLYDGDIQREEIINVLTKGLSNVPQQPSTGASQIPITSQSQQILASARNARWAVKDGMKYTKQDIDSNAWGSAIPSDATHPSNDSDASFGKLLRNREPAGPEEAIYDWEGRMMPPPEEWAERRRYNNNNAYFKASFKEYVSGLQERFGNGVPILSVPVKVLQNPHALPDGIGMRHRTETISLKNAAKYGYQDPERATMYAQTIDDAQFEVDCKLDPEDEGNATFDREETTEKLVTNWNNHIANSRGQYMKSQTVPKAASQRAETVYREVEVKVEDSQETSTEEEEFRKTEPVPLLIPKLNIYLRPATAADLQELTRMYNWYVTNNCQPAELIEVDESSMQSRMEFCIASKLPFIVAAKKSQKGAKPIPPTNDEMISHRLGLPVTHKTPVGLTRVENLAGFCCANDFTQPDFIEHISAEIEVYVDHQYRRMGVGRALMDKMLQICDLGHRLRVDVPFHCDTEVRHLYGPGGGRNIHKMIVLLRKWHTPASGMTTIGNNIMGNGQRKGRGRSRRSAKNTIAEDEYNQWLRAWFEDVGFEVEGHIKRMGGKHGRYVDLVYFGRETSWQPAEGRIPDPAPEFMDAAIGDSADGG